MRNAGKGKAALLQSGFVRRSQMRNAGKAKRRCRAPQQRSREPRTRPKVMEDYDADSVAGNSDAEVTGDTTPAVEQRSGLHCGANEPLEPEENGATVATRKPESRKLILGFIVGGQNKSVSVVEEDGYRRSSLILVAAGTTKNGADPAAPEEDVDRVGSSAVKTGVDATQDGGAGFSLSRLIQQTAVRKRLEQEDQPTPPPGSVQWWCLPARWS
eukprot:jgi/Undpi1/5467/HiC_scaffold_2.g00746.m1